jgi:2-polyprenyl-3-methyl-5-hydroxy-6-metoxy-1,4-benzoquinol methylase
MKDNIFGEQSVASISADVPDEAPEISQVWGSSPSRWGWGERVVPDMLADESGCQKFVEMSLRRYEIAARYISGKRVLDIACGVGYGSKMLRLAGATTVVGVDVSAETVRYAQQRYQIPGVEFICADAEQFEWSDQFDVIVSFETIEHLPNPIKFLENVRSLLVPDGDFVLSVPLGETRHFDPYHLHVFNQKKVFTLLEETGFSVELYRCDEFFLTRSEALNGAKLYPSSNPSTRNLLFSYRGWRVLYDFVIRGGFDIPQFLVVAKPSIAPS